MDKNFSYDNFIINNENLYDIASDNTTFDNAVGNYLRDISRFSLLSSEEEKKVGLDLKLANDLAIVKKGKKTYFELDLDNIFVSFSSNNYTKEVISLLDIVCRKDKELYCKFKNYMNYATKFNRPLNREELDKFFRIDKDISFNIENGELLIQLKKYLKYWSAREKMINSNLKLVVNQAKKYIKVSNLDFFDVISEGNAGLIKAVDKFDVDKEAKFSTYSFWWIRTYILNFVVQNNSILSSTSKIMYSAIKFNREVERLQMINHRTYSIDELVKIFELDYSTVISFMNFNNSVISLDATVGENEDYVVSDFISDERDSFTDMVNNESLKIEIEELLKSLSPIEREVISLRFGLKYENNDNNQGNKTNITKEYARIIEKRALGKIRKLARTDERIRDLKKYL